MEIAGDPIETNKKYGDKHMIVKGKVTRMGDDFGKFLDLGVGDTNIRCEIQAQHSTFVSKVKVGDTVELIGRVDISDSGDDKGKAKLKACMRLDVK